MLVSYVNALPSGRSTVQGLALGIAAGQAATADRLIKIMRRQVGTKARVVATGGDVYLAAPHCETRMVTHEMLTLEGLRRAYEQPAGQI